MSHEQLVVADVLDEASVAASTTAFENAVLEPIETPVFVQPLLGVSVAPLRETLSWPALHPALVGLL